MVNYASGPKSAPNRDSFWVRRLLNVCVLIFCAPNATILLVYIAAKINMSFIWKDDFFFVSKSASSVSLSQAHLAKRKHIGWSIGFNAWTNWTLYGVIPRFLCKIRVSDVSERFNYWERRWIDVDVALHRLSATAAIFSGVRTVFGFSRCSLSMRMPVSFTFFHKMTNIWSWWCFSPSKIRTQFSLNSATLPCVYTIIFDRRKDKTNYLSNQTWAKCYHSRNKLVLKKKR